MAISKDTILALNLSAKEVNLILDGLAAMPYKDVFHIIEKIHSQVNSQSKVQPSIAKKLDSKSVSS